MGNPGFNRWKGRGNLAVGAAIDVQRAVVDTLRARFPAHSIVAEETEPRPTVGPGPTWVLDPIDGSVNFAQGVPLFSISLAYWEEGQYQVGVVYEPHAGDLGDRHVAFSPVHARRSVALCGRAHHRDRGLDRPVGDRLNRAASPGAAARTSPHPGPVRFQPDGNRLLFHSPRAGNFDIYLADLTAPGARETLQAEPTGRTPEEDMPLGRIGQTNEDRSPLVEGVRFAMSVLLYVVAAFGAAFAAVRLLRLYRLGRR